MSTLQRTFREIARYPSAAAGFVIIIALIGISIYTLITIPYSEAIRLWRGGEDIWQENPKNAQPVWFNFFTKTDLPRTIVMSSQDSSVSKSATVISEGMTDITLSFPFDYLYSAFPQELSIYFTAKFSEKRPHLSLSWLTPDGREIAIGDFSVQQSEAYRISQDSRLIRRLKGQPPEQGLFADPNAETLVPLNGAYELRISGLVFEENADLDAKLVIYGQVHGLAGTDHRRRDLMVALLWGTPIALAFGLLAALGTTLTTMIIAAVGVWFGGWVDGVIQRITEVNLILPFLPILIMIGTLYSRGIWLMLGASILLSIFGGGIKTYRAIFLQVKEAPYIEAARAYGAGNLRTIFVYLIPRIIPVLIPRLVNVIPIFVFLEASLAVLGLGDPVLPTWGKVINEAYYNGALYQGQFYWVLEPSALLMLTGFAFALVGFALDRIFNPKLRGL
jgi:peptide/nickel transport system permease protein